jgi:hypothetical protein
MIQFEIDNNSSGDLFFELGLFFAWNMPGICSSKVELKET